MNHLDPALLCAAAREEFLRAVTYELEREIRVLKVALGVALVIVGVLAWMSV